MRRIFLIVLDSFGMGALPDAAEYGDIGSNTLLSVAQNPDFDAPILTSWGLFNIEGVAPALKSRAVACPLAAYARIAEASRGKDTTIGHWEIAGIVSERALPTYPDGFPEEIIRPFEEQTGRKVICNRPYSGTQVLLDYGREQLKTGALIVYTSADSVFQIAAHEDLIGVEQLYAYCEIARSLLVGKHAVGRVIARPYTGTYPDFVRTSRRHDYSIAPPAETMLNVLEKANRSVIGIGKISDIFAGSGITASVRTNGNEDGMEKTIAYMEREFEGLCFVNLVDFDMKYGHRNDAAGYAAAVSVFDRQLREMVRRMKEEDVVMITADHGCDPGFLKSTDHTREYVPFLAYGKAIRSGVDLGTRKSFSDIAQTVLAAFSLSHTSQSFWERIKR